MSIKKYHKHGENRIIAVEDGRIKYRYLTEGLDSYSTYDPLLMGILQNESLSPFADNDEIRFTVQKSGSVIRKTDIADLSLACYLGYIQSLDTWQADLKRFRNWKNNFHLQVDHADCNKSNNTVYNLSLMPGRINASKRETTADIKQPTYMFTGRYGDSYRIIAFFPNVKCASGKRGTSLKLKCNTTREYRNCLREIKGLYCGFGKPIYGEDEYSQRPCVTTEDVMNSMNGQEQLGWMFDCEFALYQKGRAKQLLNEAIHME